MTGLSSAFGIPQRIEPFMSVSASSVTLDEH